MLPLALNDCGCHVVAVPSSLATSLRARLLTVALALNSPWMLLSAPVSPALRVALLIVRVVALSWLVSLRFQFILASALTEKPFSSPMEMLPLASKDCACHWFPALPSAATNLNITFVAVASALKIPVLLELDSPVPTFIAALLIFRLVAPSRLESLRCHVKLASVLTLKPSTSPKLMLPLASKDWACH